MADVPTDAPEAALGPPVGTVLEGRYRLVDKLGEGGVGWVYRAEHLKLGTEVAIKMLQAPYLDHEMLRPRFEREARVLASLRHPHIVTLTDYSVAEDGHPYLVMELLEGRTLGELMDEGPMEESRARRILRQILDGLIYAHGKGFAHRDLKPTNIFLVDLPTDTDHVKILDFGFVKLLGADGGDKESLTRSGIAFGTPSYMCPEQATGGATDPRGDLYSAGIVFFEMLAGRRPFIGEIPEVIRQHLTEPVPRLDIGGAPIAAGLELRALLERAMAKEPRNRYQTAQEMRDALDALPTPALRRLDERAGPRVDGQAQTIPAPPMEQRAAEPTRPATPPTAAAARHQRGRPRVRVFPILAVMVVAGGVAAVGWVTLGERSAGTEEVAGATSDTPAETEGEAETDPTELPSAGGGAAARDLASPDEPVDLDFGDRPLDDEALPEADEPTVDEAWDDVTGTDDALYGAHEEAVDPEALADEAPPAAEPPAADPWTVREPVPILDEARRLLSTGEPLPRDEEREMRRYVRAHRDDPRAHMVLARHFLAREHTLSSVQRYSLAYAVDESARHDPTMLQDLVRLARFPVATDEATDLLARAYGQEALAPLEAALRDDELEPAERRRLEAVRDHLDALP